jgi:hypothetical protein
MNDMRKTIVPKSDQQNADDFIGGPRTIKITKVEILGGEQPVAVHFEGCEGKPYKPCKGMRRVMVQIWGGDANNYIGRSMTLFRDPKVKWGGESVGGIRISHMSDIKEKVEMALTVTRGSRKPYSVFPLDIASTLVSDDTLIDEGNEAAERGTEVLKAFWGRMKKPQQEKLQSHLDGWKKRAAEIDAAEIESGGYLRFGG